MKKKYSIAPILIITIVFLMNYPGYTCDGLFFNFHKPSWICPEIFRIEPFAKDYSVNSYVWNSNWYASHASAGLRDCREFIPNSEQSFLTSEPVADKRGVSIVDEPMLRSIIKAHEAELLSYRCQINNSTDKLIIPLEIAFSHQPEASHSFTHIDQGSTMRIDGKLQFNVIAQMAANDILRIETILQPKESIEVTIPLKILESGLVTRSLTLRHLKLSYDELAAQSWVFETQEGIMEIYRRPTGEELKKQMLEGLAQTRLYIDAPSLSEQAESAAAEHSVTMEVLFEVSPSEFSLEDAFASLGFKTDEYTYNDLFKGWAIEKDDTIYLVKEDEILTFEHIELKVFDFIKAKGPERYDVVGVWFTWAEELEKKYENIVDPSAGHHLYVPKEDMLDFLKYLSINEYRVSIGDWYLEDHILVYQGSD